jgi:aminopeptidase N
MLTLQQVNPGFGLFEQFPVKAMHPVMLTDSVPTSRPVSYQVSSPEEIDAMFDSITYDKGIAYYFHYYTCKHSLLMN